MLYECHITVEAQHAARAESTAKDLHWKFSQIDGDPVLGQKLYAYLTTHDKNLLSIHRRMEYAVVALRERGVMVVREKIELIIYDTKEKNHGH